MSPWARSTARCRDRLVDELRELFTRLGITTLYVTHDQAEAFTVADRVVLMRSGRIVQEGPPEAVWRRPVDERAARFLGFGNLVPVEVAGGVATTPWGDVPIAGGDDGDGRRLLLIRPDALTLGGGPVIGKAARRSRFAATTSGSRSPPRRDRCSTPTSAAGRSRRWATPWRWPSTRTESRPFQSVEVSQNVAVDLVAELEAPVPPAELFPWVDDLARYPQWLDIVTRAQAAGPEAWLVDLRGRLGPLARSKRLRMARTVHEPPARAVFERQETDGRTHAPWRLTASVEPAAGGSRLVMGLHYGGGLWGPVIERLLRDEIEGSRSRLLDRLIEERRH